MRFSTILFDLDGTLIDSAPDLLGAMNTLLAEIGRRPLQKPEFRRMIGEGAVKLVQRALAATGRADNARKLTHRYLEIYDRRVLESTRPYPGVEEMLPRMAACATLALCTNKPIGPTRQIVHKLGWSDHFSMLLGGDSLPTRKPAPEMVLHILAQVGADASSAVLVGDSPADAGAAAAAGIPFVAVNWGYSREPVSGLGAIAVVKAVKDLERVLKDA
ncbi:MAG: HAD-IA family hydrolase [Myxococcota bacterium]